MREPHRWALGYLRGRVLACQGGRITEANLGGAVRMALTWRVSPQQIRDVFTECAFDWDAFERRSAAAAQ